jgi:hypothetical protein
LQFNLDIEQLLLQSGVPVIYGTPVYIMHPGLIRGFRRTLPDTHESAVLDAIVCLELVDDTRDRLVTYALRLDGGDYKQTSRLPVLPGEPSTANRQRDLIRLACRYLHLPNTKQLTITSCDSGMRIRVPDVVVPQLLDRLPYDMGQDPDGVNVPIMSTMGVIEGLLQPDGDENEGVLILPDVLTFAIGASVHRLWINRTAFRWLVDEILVTPIP